MKIQGHIRRHKRKYLAAAGAAALASPFAFQRVRGAANLARWGLFGRHGKIGFKDRLKLAELGLRHGWKKLKGRGLIRRKGPLIMKPDPWYQTGRRAPAGLPAPKAK